MAPRSAPQDGAAANARAMPPVFRAVPERAGFIADRRWQQAACNAYNSKGSVSLTPRTPRVTPRPDGAAARHGHDRRRDLQGLRPLRRGLPAPGAGDVRGAEPDGLR